MRRHPLWYLCFLGLFILLLFLLREKRVPELPAQPVPRAAVPLQEPTATATASGTEPAGGRTPLALAGDEAATSRLKGQILAGGKPVATDGLLEVSVPDTGGTGVSRAALPVAEGRFEVAGPVAETLLAAGLDPNAFLYWTVSGAPSRGVALERRKNEGEPLLLLDVGNRYELDVLVQDLLGNPIEGAELRLAAPFTYVTDRPLPKTDAKGRARIVFFSDLTRGRLRVSKLGYATDSVQFALDRPETARTVSLHRVLVGGIVMDRAHYYQLSGIYPFSATGLPARDDWRPYLQKVESKLDLEAGEWVYWDVISEVEPAPPDSAIRYSVLGSSGVLATFEVPLKQLTDPTLAPVRLPELPPEESVRNWPVVVHFQPEDAFLAGWPEVVDLRFVSREGAAVDPWMSTEPGLVQRGHPEAPGAYRFWVPAGDYEIASEVARMDDPGLGLTPRLLPGVRFQVGPKQPSAEVTVTLPPDERYIGYRVTDHQGRPLNVGAQIVDGEEEELDNWVYTPSPGPWYRFIRPGRYKLCLRVKRHLLKQVMREDLYWPAPVTGDGIWVVRLPASDPAQAIERFE